MCAEAVRKQRPTRPYPEAEPEWRLEVSHICGVRPRDLLRPGVLEPPTEIVSIFGSRVAQRSRSLARSVSQARLSGVRDGFVEGAQNKETTKSRATPTLEPPYANCSSRALILPSPFKILSMILPNT